MAVAIHLMVWLYVFFTPIIIFSREGEPVTMASACRGLYFPVVSCGIFYLNYFLLIPRCLLSGRFRVFLLSNLFLVLLFTTLHEAVILRIFPLVPPPMLHPHVPPRHGAIPISPEAHGFIFGIKPLFFLRNAISLAFIAALSVIVKLSLEWHKAEAARRRAELARTESELRHLKNQLNPHFLLNTLNNIYALTAFDVEKAGRAILELSGLMRYLLYEDQSAAVPLRHEIDFLDRYVGLMRLRVNDNVDLQFTTDIKDEAGIRVAPLILVCLVENAFKHGTSPGCPCFIHISLEADRGHLAFTCENTNHPKTAVSDRSPGGIGLRQVEARLRHFYPGRHRWEYGPSADGSIYTSCLHIEF